MPISDLATASLIQIGVMLIVLLPVCLHIMYRCWRPLLIVDADANPPSELLRGQSLRKQAILVLFEKTQVTMVSIDRTAASWQGASE
jgi:hypothetical protein